MTHISNAAMADITWRKSHYSGANSNCVESGGWGRAIAVRDSKVPSGPALVFEPTSWSSFVSAVRTGGLGG